MSLSTTHKRSPRLVLLLMAIVIVLGVGVYIAVVNQTRDQLLNAFGERSLALATFTISEIDRSVQRTTKDVRLLANRLAVSDELHASNSLFDAMPERMTEIEKRDIAWIQAGAELTPLMEEVFASELSSVLVRDFPYADRDNLASDVVSTSYAEIFVTNKYGVNVAQTNRTSDYYQADEEWWQEATAHPDNLFIEDISFDESAGTYSLNIAAGIFDDDGEVIGAIKVVWNVEEIIDLLGIIEIERRDRKIFGETTHLTLLTHDAQVIYSSRDDLDFLSDARATAVGTVMEKADSETLYTIFSESDETGDVARFVTYARSSGFDTFKGLDWVLVFEQDIDEVLAPVQTTQIIIGGIIASFIVLIFYIVYVYTRHLAAVQHLKEEFISLAAHQLKTPIASNAWAIEVLEDYRDKMPEDAGTWLDTVESNTAVMNRVVKDLLNLSRLESGRFAVEPRDTDIVAEVERMMKESSFSATKNNVTFSLSVDDKVQRTLPLDTSVFQLIFDNVLSNAVKYSPNGGDIKIALTETNTHVQCAVSDTGIGIPQDTQKHIFEKFYRADNTKEHEISGTGLGLYIARLVTRRLGGDMWFTSDENSGTTFFFTIPRAGMKRKKISA